MKQITDIKECQAILLDIAKQFVDICDRHNITYYMLGGTMLGAVRHKGFIPWDDDMDFGVMREDFDTLLVALDKELPKQFKAYTWKNSRNILGQVVKIADERTETHELYKEGFTPMGINIDIFPLDYTNGRNKCKRALSHLIKRVYAYKYLSLKSRSLLKKIAAIIIKPLLFWMSKATYTSWVTSLDSSDDGNYIVNNSGIYGAKEIISKDVWGEPKKYQFEDTQFYGPADADSFLKHIYGDYMQLPPEGKRHIHLTGLYWK